MVFLSVMCVGFGKKICVYANECDVDYEISSNDGNIWIEEGETYWAQCDVGIDQIDSGSEIGINNSNSITTRATYTSYQFSHTDHVWYTNSDGKDIKLFSHTISGTVFFYTDGKVHIYSLNGDTSNVHIGYSARVADTIIANSDGSVSVGMSEVETNSLFYPTPLVIFSVTFTYGSAQATYAMSQY